MIADQEPGRPDQLDVATPEQAAPEQQKRCDENGGTREKGIKDARRGPGHRHPQRREQKYCDDKPVRDAARAEIADRDERKDGRSHKEDHGLQVSLLRRLEKLDTEDSASDARESVCIDTKRCADFLPEEGDRSYTDHGN